MLNQSAFTMVNSQNGNLAFKLFSFDDNESFSQLQRNNYFSLIWVKKGNGKVKADFSEYNFKENTLFAFAPYQPYMLTSDEQLKGTAVYFHFDFFTFTNIRKKLR